MYEATATIVFGVWWRLLPNAYDFPGPELTQGAPAADRTPDAEDIRPKSLPFLSLRSAISASSR